MEARAHFPKDCWPMGMAKIQLCRTQQEVLCVAIQNPPFMTKRIKQMIAE